MLCSLHSALNRSIIFAAFILLSLAGLLIATESAKAYHPYITELYSMHRSDVMEQYCAWVRDGSMSHNTLLTRVRDTLYVDNTSSDWDSEP